MRKRVQDIAIGLTAGLLLGVGVPYFFSGKGIKEEVIRPNNNNIGTVLLAHNDQESEPPEEKKVESLDRKINETKIKEPIEVPKIVGEQLGDGEKLYISFELEEEFLQEKDPAFIDMYHYNQDMCRKRLDALSKGVDGLSYPQQGMFVEWYVDYMRNYLIPHREEYAKRWKGENRRLFDFARSTWQGKTDEEQKEDMAEHKKKLRAIKTWGRQQSKTIIETNGYNVAVSRILSEEQYRKFEARLKGRWP